MKQALKCKSCQAFLTVPVWIYDESLGRRKQNKGWARIPAPEGSNLPEITMQGGFGDYMCPKDTALKYEKPQKHEPMNGFEYSIRPDSLTDAAKQNKHWKIECCGVYPSGKPNLSCTCGNPIGLEFGDCYTQKYILPLPRNTKWQNVKS